MENKITGGSVMMKGHINHPIPPERINKKITYQPHQPIWSSTNQGTVNTGWSIPIQPVIETTKKIISIFYAFSNPINFATDRHY